MVEKINATLFIKHKTGKIRELKGIFTFKALDYWNALFYHQS